jgi:hypothetical protein
MNSIRHSSLPKLAACGQYESNPQGAPSPAAERGTLLDNQFRWAWTNGDFPDRQLSEEDANVVRWAINECMKLGGARDMLVTDEESCRVQTIGTSHVGTVDGVALKGRWSIDLKSGQFYDYSAQMAAYAAGLMEMRCESTWTTHLLFCDQKKVVTLEWTYESATALLHSVWANVGTAPVLNDYCGWCAKSLTCPARVEPAQAALVTTEKPLTPQDHWFIWLLSDAERLGKFLAQCAVLDDFRDAAKEKARSILEAGDSVPGWKLQRPRVTEFVEAEDVALAVEAGHLGAGNAIRAMGNLSAKKALQLFSDSGVPLPEHIVRSKSSQPALVAAK